MRSWLHTVFATTLLLALVVATASLLGASLFIPGTGSAVAAVSLSDDDSSGDTGFAIVSQPLVAFALLWALVLVSIAHRSPAHAGKGEPHQARAPPSR